MATPVKGVAYVFYITLVDDLNPNTFKVNPTIAAGDFQVSIDGGAFANLTTLPVVTPASSRTVKVSLDATEMDGDNINVVGVDVTGAEWQELVSFIVTEGVTHDSKLTDIWQNMGLDISEPLAITPASRVAGSVDLTLGGDGINLTTVTRNP